MSEKILLALWTLAILGCGKQSAISATANTVNNGATVESNNPYIVSVATTSGGKQFFAIPDALTTTLLDPIHFPNGGPEGEKARFAIWGYPSFSEKLRNAIAAFENANRGVRVKRVNPNTTPTVTLRQTWLKTPAEIGIIFLTAPNFGPEVRTDFPFPSQISFIKQYWLTDSGAHFLQMLEDQPKNLNDYFKFRYCYSAEQIGVDDVTVWKGNVCVSTPSPE